MNLQLVDIIVFASFSLERDGGPLIACTGSPPCKSLESLQLPSLPELDHLPELPELDHLQHDVVHDAAYSYDGFHGRGLEYLDAHATGRQRCHDICDV